MIGKTISHYQVVEKIGEGTLGVVYKAEDTKLKRTVALKFLAADVVQGEEYRARFFREAKAAAALDHPNICPMYEIDEIEGKVFIAMAYIEGDSLDKKIAQGPLKISEALNIAQEIGKGLEAPHKKGIFHRDIKPENVIVDGEGHVTIIDFGLAQLTSRPTRGTVAYMSPEQVKGSGIDHRTDIWSLGVVLYEMVSGQRPFRGEYDKAVTYSVVNEEPEPLTALRTGVPIELDQIVGKALAKRPEERYQHVQDMLVDLRAVPRQLPRRDPAVVPSRQPKRKAVPWALALLGVATFAAVGSNSWLRLGDKAAETDARQRAVNLPAPRSVLIETVLPAIYVTYADQDNSTNEVSLTVRVENTNSKQVVEIHDADILRFEAIVTGGVVHLGEQPVHLLTSFRELQPSKSIEVKLQFSPPEQVSAVSARYERRTPTLIARTEAEPVPVL